MSPLQRLTDRIAARTATVAIVGLGYVGLPTALAFCKAGYRVVGVDTNREKVASIEAGTSPIPDTVPHVDMAATVRTGRFSVTTEGEAACKEADIVLLIVPTPVTRAKQPDLSHVKAAADTVLAALHPGQLIVLESTTYPGTTDEFIVEPARGRGLRLNEDFGVAYCPERINPGDPHHPIDTVHRVLGASSPAWAEVASAFYGGINGGRITIVRDIKTAEAAKVIENIQRDLNIALVNEFALIFERLGIDTHEVLEAASTKWNFVRYSPGPGVGGHCLPVDPYYLTSIAEQMGYHPQVILAGRAVNDQMPIHVVDLLIRMLNKARKPLNGSTVTLLGLAYKGNTGDARESPAESIVKALRDLGARVVVTDPLVPARDVEKIFSAPITPLETALGEADAVILVTDHDEYRQLPLATLLKTRKDTVILDTRRSWHKLGLSQHRAYRYLGGIA